MSVPESKSLADQRVQKILDEIANLNKKMETLSAKPQVPERVEHDEKPDAPLKPAKHFSAEDLDTNCPECQKGIEAWKQKIITDERAKFDKEHPQFCLDCGTHVKEEDKECPHCHGRNGRART